MHKAGAFVAFDYSAVGATSAMDLAADRAGCGDRVYDNPLAEGEAALSRPDAAMLAPHCIPGGVGANSVLVISRAALRKALSSSDGAALWVWLFLLLPCTHFAKFSDALEIAVCEKLCEESWR
jgi:hypothetical protein